MTQYVSVIRTNILKYIINTYFLKLLIVLLICLVLLTGFQSKPSAQVIPRFRGNSQNTGVFPGPAPKSGKLKWRFKTGRIVASSPTAYMDAVYFGSSDGYFYSVHIKDGSLVWKFKTQRDTIAGSVIYNDIIYFGATDGYLYALDVKNGELIQKSGYKAGFRTTPVIQNSILYVADRTINFYALDLNNLDKPLWIFQTRCSSNSSPALFEGKIFFKSCDHLAYALSTSSHKSIWNYKHLNHVNHGTVTVENGLAYFGDDKGMLYAVDVDDGSLTWKFKTRGRIDRTPAVTEKMVFVGSNDTILYGLDAKTGVKIWRFKAALPLRSAPIVCENSVFVGGDDQYVYSLNSETGRLNWKFKMGEKTRSHSPFIKDGILFIGSNDHYLYAIE